MTHLFILFLIWFQPASSLDSMYQQLDHEISIRDTYVQQKQHKIDSLQVCLQDTSYSTEKRQNIADELFHQYFLLNADSAMVYANLAFSLSNQLDDPITKQRLVIEEAQLLATVGYFEEAHKLLSSIQPVYESNKRKFYEVAYWTYFVWAEYNAHSPYFAEYETIFIAYADSIIQSIQPPLTGEDYYWMGEYEKLKGNYTQAEAYYKQSMQLVPNTERTYASGSCALAFIYLGQKRYEEFEQAIILSAISDQVCALKENLSLQVLAEYLANIKGDRQRAYRYLYISLNDAIQYNNRLRLIEVARKFPNVVFSYQQTEKKYQEAQLWVIGLISVLVIVLIIALIIISKERNKVQQQHNKVDSINKQLQSVNDQLKATNRTREKYAGLFIELSASYVAKYNKFYREVSERVKIHPSNELLILLHNNRVKDVDSKAFFLDFDAAFLALYPTFVVEVNQLLQSDKQLVPPNDYCLSNELRILALIRLGVHDTQKIATLLLYSPQTVYNFRSKLKSSSLSPETFEQDLMQLCSL